jgi:hypothetical protein
MVGAGVLTIVGAFVGGGWGVGVALTALMIAAIVPIVYSYVMWSRERGGPSSR